MFNTKQKKTAASIISVFCAIIVFFSSVTIYKTGLIRGIDEEIDAQKDALIVAAAKAKTVEGIFIDRNGVEITSYSPAGQAAYVNFPESFSHLIGYNSSRLGLYGLRKKFSKYLFDDKKDNVGATVQLTINAPLQEKLYNLLDGSVGSISIVNATTGEIIAMTSRGDSDVDYNLNLIDAVYSTDDNEKPIFYSDIYAKIDEFYLNRAILANDPPGSCIKAVTAASLIENDMKDLVYFDTGCFLNEIYNSERIDYGNCDLKMGLNNSVNTYFANAGVVLGAEKLKRTFLNFMIGETISLDFGNLSSTFSSSDDASDLSIASNAYGQGEVIMTPLHIAMMMGAIINEDGKMMKPYVIDNITNNDRIEYQSSQELISNAIDKDSRAVLTELLNSNAIKYNLYKPFNKDDLFIIAKTGTAQVADPTKGKYHVYYSIGVEYNGNCYGICVDRDNTNSTSSVLENIAIETVKALVNANI